jgi:signal transduction histidine kinase
MTVRFRLALTVLLTGVLTAIGVIATVTLTFQRFGHESTYARADAFLGRVVGMYDDLLDLHQRNPQDFTPFLRNLLLFEPDSQLYLLAADGTVLAHTGQVSLPPGFKVALGPVQKSAAGAVDARARMLAPYVMGDDPEHMDSDAVVAARVLRRALIRPADPVAGYLYVVCSKQGLPGARNALFRSSLMGPALVTLVLLIVGATLLALWIIGTVTRPLQVLSAEVAAASRDGFSGAAALAGPVGPASSLGSGSDEFAQLRQGFRALLSTLRMQWDELRRLDHFRRESVSNLSHDLRSPLTATVACLETLEQRWAGDASRSDDRRLVQVALRNTRNAAGMVRSLGDLALLDEPEFKLRTMRLDLAEVLDDIVLRFAERAARQGVALRFAPAAGESSADAPVVAEVDVELFERALANLLDNALKYTPPGAGILLHAERSNDQGGHRVHISVADEGSGIAAAELPQLFDRLYQARSSVAPATSDEGKGLGLAIVKRIVELHRGTVAVQSTLGRGTTVRIELPAA